MCIQIEKESILYWPDTAQIKTKTWYNENNQIHKIDGPAYIEYNKNNTIKIMGWFQNGKKHNINGPAFIYFNNNIQYCTEWYQFGIRHRIDGPAYIRQTPNTKYESWFIHGKRDRKDGPAHTIEYYSHSDNKKLVQEYWFCNGELYREKGPNVSIYSAEKYEYYF
jgi:hypothetical protein